MNAVEDAEDTEDEAEGLIIVGIDVVGALRQETVVVVSVTWANVLVTLWLVSLGAERI
jgi:hypothetical protein